MWAPRQVQRLGRLAGQAIALAGATRAGAAAHGAGRLAVLRRARLLRREHGFEYDEALRLGLLDPSVPEATCAAFVSRHVNMAVQYRLNRSEMPPLVGHKLVFHRRCEELGLPVPRLYGVVERDGPLSRADAFIALVEQELPDEFVVKPALGYEGFGVRVLRRERGRLVGPEGRATTAAALLAELRADPEFEAFLLQERLHNHAELAALCGETPLHTLRIMTLVDPAGEVLILAAALRLGLSGASVDSFHGGTLGNGLCEVESAAGTLGPAILPRPDGCGLVSAPALPGSGRRIEGLRVPLWTEARDLALRAARGFLPLRTLGWDVALTPGGPVVVEANTRWGAFPTPRMRAVVARLETA